MFVDLVRQSLDTVELFELRSREATKQTIYAYHFLFKGKEPFALLRLGQCENLAREKGAKTHDLEEGFRKAVDQINQIIVDAKRRQGIAQHDIDLKNALHGDLLKDEQVVRGQCANAIRNAGLWLQKGDDYKAQEAE